MPLHVYNSFYMVCNFEFISVDVNLANVIVHCVIDIYHAYR